MNPNVIIPTAAIKTTAPLGPLRGKFLVYLIVLGNPFGGAES